jgi:hypothetical protein
VEQASGAVLSGELSLIVKPASLSCTVPAGGPLGVPHQSCLAKTLYAVASKL